jgi:hypothetical protein
MTILLKFVETISGDYTRHNAVEVVSQQIEDSVSAG